MESRNRPLVILTGPTAVGKTALSVALAARIGGEIISADSMQVYRHMDIGSAKVTKAEMGGIRHHLIDVLEPTQEFNVVVFQRLARQAMREIWDAGHIPIVTGGTGFYIQALLYDIDFTENDGDLTLRRKLEQIAAGPDGPNTLHAILESVDADSAAAIHANNTKRVIRAIEYYRETGEKISAHNERERQRKSPYNFAYYVLNTDRETLYRRIEARVDRMLSDGLIAEVERLKSMGLNRKMTSMQGLGYKEILAYLDGETTLCEAVRVLKRDTRHFAKRQLTWFRRERGVTWICLAEPENSRETALLRILSDLSERKILNL